MTVKFTNNASTTVGTGINTSATSLTVASASSFPSLSGADDYCYLTLQEATGTNREVVKATALSSNTFTIVRAQDNTSARSWSAGDIVELRMTAALLTDVIDAATVEGVKTNFQYTPTSNQTVFSGADNSSNTLIINAAALVSVYLNGIRLVQGTDYTVSSSNNTVTLSAGVTTADIVDIEVFGNFTGQSGAAVAITGGAITGTSIAATTLSASSTATLNTFVSSGVTITGGTIQGTNIGATTAGTGRFSTLEATGNATLSGNVGIGAASAAARLEVTGAFGYASGANSLATTVSKAAARIRGSSDATTSLFFGSLTNDAEQYIQSSNGAGTGADDLVLNPYGGKVGIGTSSPDTLLELVGADPILTVRDSATSSGTANATLRLAESGASDSLDAYWDIKAVGGQLQFIDNWTEGGGTGTRVVIDDSGKVGIGVTPYYPLHVSGAATANGEAKTNALFFDTTSATTGTGGGIALGGYSNGTGGDVYHFGNIQGIKENSTAGNYASAILFSTRANGATPTEKMRISSSGKVGIGTSSPDAKFEVEWTGSQVSTDNIARITAPTYPSLEFYSTNTNASNRNWKIAGVHNSFGTLEFLRSSSANGTPNVTTLAMNANGHVGIGTHVPEQLLHVHGGNSGSSYNADGADKVIIENSDSVTIDFRTPANAQALLLFSDGTRARGLIGYNHSDDTLRFAHSGATTFQLTSTEASFYGPAGNSAPGVVDIYGRNHSSYGSSQVARSRIGSVISGSANAYFTDMVLSTTNTSNVMTERLRLYYTGAVRVNNGFLKLSQDHGIRVFTGYIAGNASANFDVALYSQGSCEITAVMNHYGYISGYGCARKAICSNGPGVSSGSLSVHDVFSPITSGYGGEWIFGSQAGNNSSVRVTKNAGTYAGGGYYMVKVEGNMGLS